MLHASTITPNTSNESEIAASWIQYHFPEATDSQVRALNAIHAFLTSKDSCFILRGTARTGKTAVIKVLIGYLQSKGIPLSLMAPTAMAAKTLFEDTNEPTSTIHSNIYTRTVKDDGGMGKYVRTRSSAPQNTVYIIDGTNFQQGGNEDETPFSFGSGNLLDDLLYNVNGRKIIVFGDKCFISFDRIEYSSALTRQGYLSRENPVNTQLFDLDESPMFYPKPQQNSALDKSHFFTALCNEHDSLPGKYSDIEYVEDQEEFIKQYLQTGREEIGEKAMLIVHSNNQTNDYNMKIRKKLFPSKDTITEGDRITVLNRNYAIDNGVRNGDFGTVIAVSENRETKWVRMRKDQANKELFFRDCTVRFRKNRDIKCKLLENCLYYTKDTKSIFPIQAALWDDFRLRYKDIIDDQISYNQIAMSDDYLNCLYVRYGYALTCHKACSGKWDTVFIAEPDNQVNMEWFYMALSRAKKKAIIYKKPSPICPF